KNTDPLIVQHNFDEIAERVPPKQHDPDETTPLFAFNKRYHPSVE
ncbi:8313_t:CDS:1, partial [Racocetra persica]